MRTYVAAYTPESWINTHFVASGFLDWLSCDSILPQFSPFSISIFDNNQGKGVKNLETVGEVDLVRVGSA